MAFNINDFKAKSLKFGGARPSLFEVILTIPTIGIIDVRERLRFTCRASSIPASSISSIEVPYFGRKIKLAGDRTFADWNVTVMNDEDFSVRDMFEQWSQRINHNQDNQKLDSANKYKGQGLDGGATAIVRQYSKIGKPIAEYKFIGLFPTEISAMELDWDSTNQIQTFNVTFAYDYYINARNDYNRSAGRDAALPLPVI